MKFNLALFLIVTITYLMFTTTMEKEEKNASGHSYSAFEKVDFEDSAFACVEFNDQLIDSSDLITYSQQVRLLIRKIGKKYTKIVLTLFQLRLKSSRITKSSIFLNALNDENVIRKREGLTSIKVFLHIPIAPCHGHNVVPEINDLTMALLTYIENEAMVSGLILEKSFIQNLNGNVFGNEDKFKLVSNISKLKKLLRSIQYIVGYDLGLGLIVNSYHECMAFLIGATFDVMSSLDFVIFNWTSKFPVVYRNDELYAQFEDCIKLSHTFFPQFSFYYVNESFNSYFRD